MQPAQCPCRLATIHGQGRDIWLVHGCISHLAMRRAHFVCTIGTVSVADGRHRRISPQTKLSDSLLAYTKGSRWVDSAGPGRSPGRFLNDFFAIFKQNWHTARPTAPRWKAHIETCQKTNRKRMRAVQAEGQGAAQVRACSCRACCARGGQAGARAQ
eukprot:scaffold16544_cov29-Phaeocystis_antarctica.AAC.1